MQPQKIQLPIKPYKKIIATNIDYYRLFLELENQFSNCYLFESLSDERRKDLQTSFGFNPLFTVRAKGNNLYFNGNLEIFGTRKTSIVVNCDNPYRYLQSIFPNPIKGKTREGGLIGYVSYEAINYFEPALDLIEHPDFYQFNFGFYDHGLIYDSITNELEYYYYFEDKSETVEKILSNLQPYQCLKINSNLEIVDQGSDITKNDYESIMNSVFSEIQKGNTFQVEVGMKNKYQIIGRKMKIYNYLRDINPSPYMIYVKSGNEEIIGASPEILISCTNNYVVTMPTAGTVNRGSNEAEDQKLTNEMLENEKEVAEHSMLVDLHRNDLGKIATLDSVEVEELMHIIKFSHVQHIVSKIICQKDKQYDSFDILASILPGGVLTGVPKIETMKIISRNESEPRGPYGGAVGRFSFNGDCAFALPIRTLFCSGNNCFTQTCSGVVLDSIIESEYIEIQNKAMAIKLAIMKSKD